MDSAVGVPGQCVERVDLHPGEVVLHYRRGGSGTKNQGHDPFGPPWGAWGQWSVEVADEAVRRPRCRGEAAL
ncbi:MAG: hypothetical protein FJ102_16440 [Deltaproteobacteria bacterium]|nr:hypothetical protein [Deltaproteobacteria bacterium]